MLATVPVASSPESGAVSLQGSSDGVVASASGFEGCSTVASDSPTLVLKLRAISLRAFRTSSLFAATALLSIENVSGVAVLCYQAHDLWLPPPCDRALQDRRTCGSLADLLSQIRRQPRLLGCPIRTSVAGPAGPKSWSKTEIVGVGPTVPGAACRQTPDRPLYSRNPRGQGCPSRSASPDAADTRLLDDRGRHAGRRRAPSSSAVRSSEASRSSRSAPPDGPNRDHASAAGGRRESPRRAGSAARDPSPGTCR